MNAQTGICETIMSQTERALSNPTLAQAALPGAIVDLAAKVDATPLQTEPFEHIYMENIFPPATYRRLQEALPPTRYYRELNHKDAMMANGESARRQFDLYPERTWFLPAEHRAFWRQLAKALCSTRTQAAFKRKFKTVLEERFGTSIDKLWFYPVPLLVRDLGGYRITIHRDAQSKGITVQFYLPRDDTQAHLGTIFHDGPDGEAALRTKKLGFRPSTGYSFPVQLTKSWHSVSPTSDADGERNSMMIIYYVQKGLFGRIKYRFWRFVEFFRYPFTH